MKLKAIIYLLSLSILGMFLMVGCERSDDGEFSWNGSSENSSNNSQDTSNNTPGNVGTNESAGDQVPFSSLNFCYGGFDGSRATHQGVEISSLKMDADGLSYKYIKDLSQWGISYDDHRGALICLFVKNNAGNWVGGKIDWISSNRTTRDFHNVYGHYNGWTLKDVPNPCDAALVIVHVNGTKRSNVIKSTWPR